MNTHIAAIYFSGDPACEHDDDELRGRSPHLTLIASGSEEFCWQHVAAWTEKHPLREWESVEVLARTMLPVERGVPGEDA